jgi:hypothetical protein
MRIDHKYDVKPETEPAFHVGAYVRKVGDDMGTGLIVAVGHSDVLEEKTNRVFHQRIYHVHWLQMNKGDLYSTEPEILLAGSARSVPKFETVEDAEAWMAQQLQPGNWTGAAQDAADSSSDMDVALQKILEEGE